MTSLCLRYGAALSAAFFYAVILAVVPAAFLPRHLAAPPSAYPTSETGSTPEGIAQTGAFPAVPAPPRGETGAPWPAPPAPLFVAAEDDPDSDARNDSRDDSQGEFRSDTDTEIIPETQATCPAYQLPAAMLWARWAPYDLDVTILAPELARSVVAEVNRIPPRTAWTPQRVKIAEGQAASAVVMEFADGCAWTSGPRPKPEIRALLNRAAAGGA